MSAAPESLDQGPWPFLDDGGACARLIAATDWSGSPLGRPETWPQSLRVTLATILRSPVPIVLLWGPDGVMLYNDAYSAFAGGRHPRLLGSKVREGWPEVADFNDNVMKVVLSGRPLSYKDMELTLYRSGGPEQVFMNLDYSPVPGDDGQPAGVIAVVVETTERVLAERKLQESEERRRLAAEAARIGTWDLDLTTGTGHWDTAAVGIAGLPQAERGYDIESWLRIVHPEDRERAGAAFLESLAPGGPAYDVEFRSPVPAPDGGPRWLASHGAVFREARTGAAVRAVGILQDVTDRRRREERLAAREAQLASSLSAGRMAAWTFDPTTGRIERSENADEIFGPGTTPEVFNARMPPEDQAADRARLEAALDGRAPRYESEFRYRHPDGRLLWLLNWGQVVRDEAGRPLRVHGACLDVTARKEAELALATSEERLRLAQAAGEIGLWDWDIATGAVVWSEGYYRVWRIDPAEPPSFASFLAAIDPAQRPAVEASLARALAEAAPWSSDLRLAGPESGPRWIFARGEFRRGPDGRPTRMVGVCFDITAQKCAEEALRRVNETLEQRVADALAERKLLADVFEGTDAMISVADPELRLLAFNRRYADEVERLGGRRPRLGDRIPELYASRPELAVPVEANWRRAVAGETFSVTEAHGDPSRYRRSYERRFEPIRDRRGRLAGAYQYATDVTDRLADQLRATKAEAARQEADARYRAYFQNSAEALFVVGVRPDGRFTFEEVNPTHSAALGVDLAAHDGRPIDEVLPPEAAAAVGAHYRRAVETGEVQRYRETAELGGRVIHAETVLVPVRDAEGRVVRLVGSSRDMTAQVQAEEALRQSQKMEAMGQLTGGVAHDFNNLLTPILGVFDRLLRRGLPDERDRRLVEGAMQSAERARILVQRLLAFARRQPLQPAAVDAGEVVRGMADLVSSTTGPQIRVTVEVEPGLPPARADANQLEMAILNLAVNARDAMPDGGSLRISATVGTAPAPQGPAELAPGAYVRVSVADTGVGMDEATLARAVEPFFSTKGIGRGTGLGLSMAHGLAAQLGGALTIRSRPGLGTNVELWLPVAGGGAPQATAASAARAEAPPRGSGTVLLVDDEELVRAATAEMLTDLGFAVVEAESADEALRRLDAGLEPEIVVTDHLMAGLNGTELARIIEGRRAGLPVLLVSGFADVEGVASDLPRLAKPFRRDELAASLASLLTKPEPSA